MALYLTPLLLTLAFCFGIQSIALKAVGGHTTKSESNFFSSLARIQRSVHTRPNVLLLGSSRMGRLPDGDAPSLTVANLGCDGGSAAITLRAIGQGLLPAAPVIVIEGNTLLHDLEHQGHQIGEALEGSWFRLGAAISNLSATARPSAFVYCRLLEKRLAAISYTPAGGSLLHPTLEWPQQPQALPAAADQLTHQLADLIASLQNKGCKVRVVMLPPAADPDLLNTTLPLELARISQIPLLDLAKDLPPGSVRYTDGVHMAPASAAAALRSILNAIKTLP